MNLVLIQSQGRGNDSILTRISDRKITDIVSANFDNCFPEEAQEVIEEFRVGVFETKEIDYDATI